MSFQSPESDVVVVRLVPEPLRIRILPFVIRGMLLLDNRDIIGAEWPFTAPHSFPRAAAWANTLRLAFLFSSNCARAVSCNTSLVFVLPDCQLSAEGTICHHVRVSVVRRGEAVVVAHVILASTFDEELNDLSYHK